MNPATNQIYVANMNSNNVTVIDGATNTATATVTVGSQPMAIAVNPVTNKIYTASGTVIDGASNSTTALNAGGWAVAVNPVTNTIYADAPGGFGGASGTVTVIDGTGVNPPTTVSVGNGYNPCAVAVNPLTNKIYVSNSKAAPCR